MRVYVEFTTSEGQGLHLDVTEICAIQDSAHPDEGCIVYLGAGPCFTLKASRREVLETIDHISRLLEADDGTTNPTTVKPMFGEKEEAE